MHEKGPVMKGVHRLIVTIKEIRGKCPVFNVGDRIVIEGPKIVPGKTDALCVHALGSMLSMIIALGRGVSFKELGLAKEEGNVGYVQCLDPGPPYTLGGTVIFEIRREAMEQT
ncbi:MAG: hypothetical protein AOA66_0390 [Candidatus Bathyarchaeota archaeon BA2]|nr:MAG: hypothetical protein AOA66_0390 [Candidatus Bathyarchaeota archaeon BA2]